MNTYNKILILILGTISGIPLSYFFQNKWLQMSLSFFEYLLVFIPEQLNENKFENLSQNSIMMNLFLTCIMTFVTSVIIMLILENKKKI